VLEQASLCIEPGEHVAVVGPSGAGKSTLLRLFLRLCEPQSGSVRLDGRAVTALTLASLRREVGVVLQDALVVGETIAANIRYGRLEASDAEIERAARLAGVHEFVAALPDGYATVVGERGARLSGGQRQRLCLARTLVRDPAVLILDEPTSAVDAESAALIERSIAWHRRGRTTVVIGHQFASLESFDRVLEVGQGRIVDVTARVRAGPMAAPSREVALS
jgi:ABC-type multidrug transport system fused ATPase/permease subunit